MYSNKVNRFDNVSEIMFYCNEVRGRKITEN